MSGSDQLLGNALYLRHNAFQKSPQESFDFTVGIDVESRVFVSEPPFAALSFRNVSDNGNESSSAFCKETRKNEIYCPGFIHFNGFHSADSILERYFVTLTWTTAVRALLLERIL